MAAKMRTTSAFDAALAARKRASREADREAHAAGRVTRAELQEQNSVSRGLARPTVAEMIKSAKRLW